MDTQHLKYIRHGKNLSLFKDKQFDYAVRCLMLLATPQLIYVCNTKFMSSIHKYQ